uniref:Uncharacterized protein At2g37435/F3G5.14 n=1 Tax=Arabidopsis thaliana TaxID=3702 RepID=Q84RK1_ARATH|nr:hypothetical protein [Arabidopsis thaliana]
MGDDLPDWRNKLEPVFLEFEDGCVPEEHYYPCIRRREDEEPKISAEEEYYLMVKEVEDSKGFDIDFAKFRCVFNYRPVDLDDNELALEPETTREFMDRLCRKSLEHFNEIHSTKYEFVRFIKANHQVSAGMMYFIPLEGKLLSNDDDSKQFQVKFCYWGGTPEIISWELKP